MCRSFLKALLPHLGRAQALLDWTPPEGAESSGTDQRARLLDLLAALLTLSAPSLLNPLQPASRFVCDAYAELLRIRRGVHLLSPLSCLSSACLFPYVKVPCDTMLLLYANLYPLDT